jgi:PAS domain S-box-containing protein
MANRSSKAAPPSPDDPRCAIFDRLLVEQLPAVLWSTDRELRFTSSAGAGLANLRLRPNELVGVSLYQYFQTDDPEFLPIAASRRALAGESCSFEITWQARTFHAHVEPFRDRQGQISGTIGAALDITERKRAEEALRESEELHRVIAELTSDYAYTARVEADGTVRIESVTGGFTRVTGYTLEELEPLGGWVHLIHPDDLGVAQGRLANILEGRRGVHELRIRTRGGEVRWIRYSIQPIRDPVLGRVTRLLGAVQDVTSRKRAAEQLQDYAVQLRNLSRRLLDTQEEERRRLARELHDEIGQSLTGLKLSLETAARAGAVGTALADAAALVNRLIAQVRDLSLDLRPGMLDDLGLLPALVWLIERYTARTGVRVALEHRGLCGRLPAQVETAAYRIAQEALTNVARHAGVREATVRVWLDRDVLGVQVADGGAGFDAETAAAQGTSSGLAGMRERAQLLGGRLRIESAARTGTCLTAELPLGEGDGRLP